MLSINARKVLFALLGVIVASFVVSLVFVAMTVANIFNLDLLSATLWFPIVIAIIESAIGIAVGLMWEKWRRARYIEMFAKNPGLQEKTEKIYRVALVIGIVYGGFYLLSNAWAVYVLLAFSRLNLPFPNPTGLYIGLGRYVVLGLVSVWLFADSKRKTGERVLNISKGLLLCIIYCFAMAFLTLIALSTISNSPTINTVPIQAQQTTTTSTTSVSVATSGSPVAPGVAKSFEVIFPQSGQILERGLSYTIRWQCTGYAFFSALIVSASVPSSTANPYEIFSVPAASSSYRWTVPTSSQAGGGAFISFLPGPYKMGFYCNNRNFDGQYNASTTMLVSIVNQ
ncbi:MAG: hypothetical protein ABR884_00495 [Minisyncoccia bacterium]|jgi:hypothetical protein